VSKTLCTETAPSAALRLPVDSSAELPLTVIERKRGWQLLGLGEMWRFRELLFFLVWRDIKVRYKQTVLGAAWAILQPLATMAAFSLFLGRVAQSANPDMPYPLFVLAGLIPWTFFASAVTSSSTSVLGNERLVTKIYFPRLLVPFSTVAAAAFDFLIAFVMLVAVALGFFFVKDYKGFPGWEALALPAVVLVELALASGLGVLLAALTVKFRDFRAMVPLVLQLWMFSTPAIFLQDWKLTVGERMAPWLPLNPIHGVVVNFRAVTVGGGGWDPWALAVSAGWAVVLLAVGCFYFRRVERGFADII
jgi:lipopolysaccharide transport system permease protein